MNKDEINAKYRALHAALGSIKDAEDKELFNQQHRQVWADCDIELQARKAELEAFATLTDAEKVELGELENLFPTPVVTEPARDLFKEVDELREEINRLKEI